MNSICNAAWSGAPYSSPEWIVSFILAVLLLGFFDFALFKAVKRKVVYVFGILIEAVMLIASCFEGMELLVLVCAILLICGAVAALFSNVAEYRFLLSNAYKGKSGLFNRHQKKNVVPEKLFDREALYEKVYQACMDMSRLKRGALITFMKKDNLLDDSKIDTVIKQRGVDVDAPVTPELLETIFYVGTRLHDGAVIIKDDKIARAAVFFQSTAKPLTGKYGSRHQAALGISENSDSVTIVVSEETGRISIAFQGELTPVTPDNFLRVFEDDMAYEPEDNLLSPVND